MLRVRRDSPLDYRLCDQTVTIYHQTGAGKDFSCTRTVFRGAYLDFRKTRNVEKTGSKDTTSFLLVLPCRSGGPAWVSPDQYSGTGFTLSPQDKVLLGEGPAVTTRDAWAALIPAKNPNLVVVQYVDPKYWNGAVTHVEAGG